MSVTFKNLMPEVMPREECIAVIQLLQRHGAFTHDLAILCHSIGRDRGFWDTIAELPQDPNTMCDAMDDEFWTEIIQTYRANHIRKQILHLYDEYGEFDAELLLDYKAALEEAADIFIVLCDIMYWEEGWTMRSDELVKLLPSGTTLMGALVRKIDALNRTYRKSGRLSRLHATYIVQTLLGSVENFATPNQFLDAVLDKCLKNLNRPNKYGIAE